MYELPQPLRHVLEATGYFAGGRPAAPTVAVLSGADRKRRRAFCPEVQWRGRANLSVYFKFTENPTNKEIGSWHQEVWNEGNTPLLWLVGPTKTDLYNGFSPPKQPAAVTENRLNVFHHDVSGAFAAQNEHGLDLNSLNARAGRLSMETGHFWKTEPRVNRKATVDRRLLQDIAALERALLATGLSVDAAQGLIGRSIFAKYLVDRQIISEKWLRGKLGSKTLSEVLRRSVEATMLFDWLEERFNGDMFPSKTKALSTQHLQQVADFLDGVNLQTGQGSLFPYRFDLIPVELISSIYEQFVHSADAVGRGTKAKRSGVYYTPLSVVSLILDEIMNGLSGNETVLDITCGSGVFLVEALRRLVDLKAGGNSPTRAMIREALYQQVHGVDISPAAIRVAAFSLYLAALELDPNPRKGHGLKFKPLVGRTLLVGDAHNVQPMPQGKAVLKKGIGKEGFDLVVGNPPFTEDRDRGQARMPDKLQPSRDRSLVFAERALHFTHPHSRLGIVLKATPFFSRHGGRTAAQNVLGSLGPATLVNLSSCSSWLFQQANAPVVVLLARHERRLDVNHLKLVQAHWSPAGPQGHAFDIGPSDVATLHLNSWKRNGDLFKAAFFGRYDDLILLDSLRNAQKPLSLQLGEMGAKFSVGLIAGRNGRRDATFLRGLPLLDRGGLRPFAPRKRLPRFTSDKAHRPRERSTYQAPLLIVEEYMHSIGATPRAVVAVSERDVVFKNLFYGASLPEEEGPKAHLLAGILSSAMASWYFITAGSTFGIDKRRLLQEDITAMPVPNLAAAVKTAAGRKLLALAKSFVAHPPSENGWRSLDEAVFDLYELNEHERMIVHDGVFRASWQWQPGWQASVEPASREDLAGFARAFLSVMEPWMPRGGSFRMRAEIHEPAPAHPLRAIRFVLDNASSSAAVEFVSGSSAMTKVIEQAGPRFDYSLGEALSGHKAPLITLDGDILVVKPSSGRHWLASSAFMEARAVLEKTRISDGRDEIGAETTPRLDVQLDEEIALRYRTGYRDTAALNDELDGWAAEGAWPED